MITTRRTAARTQLKALILAPCLALTLAAPTAQAIEFRSLTGVWSGWGVLRGTNTNHERVKCYATYASLTERSLNLNLRCASSSLRMNALIDLTRDGEDIRGTWQDRVYETSGTVSGRTIQNGFLLDVDGASFTAAMAMTASKCSQAMTFTPAGLGIEKISVGLKRC